MRTTGTFLLLFTIIVFSGCNDDDDSPELQSKWKLIAMLMDPGDGSGEFYDVDSDKTIEFFDDGTFESNGSLCVMDQGNSTQTTGVYSETAMTMSPEGCSNPQTNLTYAIEDGHLIVSFLCFEACREKYERID